MNFIRKDFFFISFLIIFCLSRSFLWFTCCIVYSLPGIIWIFGDLLFRLLLLFLFCFRLLRVFQCLRLYFCTLCSILIICVRPCICKAFSQISFKRTVCADSLHRIVCYFRLLSAKSPDNRGPKQKQTCYQEYSCQQIFLSVFFILFITIFHLTSASSLNNFFLLQQSFYIFYDPQIIPSGFYL